MLNAWATRLTLSKLPASHTQKYKPSSVYVALE